MRPVSRLYSLLRPTKGVASLAVPAAESGAEEIEEAGGGGGARGVPPPAPREKPAPPPPGWGERRGEPFSQPPRWAALVGLDFSDGETRAADPLGGRLLGEGQGFAGPPPPIT